MDEKLIKNLEDLGLSEKEAKVYLATLTIGASSVQQISESAGIKRVTAYVILESLMGMGLVDQTNQGRKTLFVAKPPASLKRLLSKKAAELKEQEANFEAVLPQLVGLSELPKEMPSVQVYHGIEASRATSISLFADRREKPSEIVRGISNIDNVSKFMPEIKRGGNPERIASGTHSKFIYTSKDGAVLKPLDKASNRESRYVPYEKFPLRGDFSITGDRIVMDSLGGTRPMGVIIRNKELATGFAQIFDLLWEKLGEDSTKK